MRRALTIALALTWPASATNALAEANYEWTLSLSDTDPYVNTGPSPPVGPFPVYLWLAYNVSGLPDPGGAFAAEFDLQTSASWSVTGFSPAANVFNIGTPAELLLAIGGCPEAPFLAGSFTLLDAAGTGGEACLVPSAMNGLNVTVDCDPIVPLQHDNAIIGVSTIGGPCRVGSPFAVERDGWGSVKGLYR
jgi:hypothetical protein